MMNDKALLGNRKINQKNKKKKPMNGEENQTDKSDLH